MCIKHQVQHVHAHVGVKRCICDIYNPINKPVGIQRKRNVLKCLFFKLECNIPEISLSSLLKIPDKCFLIIITLRGVRMQKLLIL
jgi:hypothetical protein